MLQWHTQHRLQLGLNTKVTAVEVCDLDWPQEEVEKEEKEEVQKKKVELQYIWGVMKETQLAILGMQVGRLNTCSRAKHGYTKLNMTQLLCKYCPIAKKAQGNLKIPTNSIMNSVWVINKKLLKPSIYK